MRALARFPTISSHHTHSPTILKTRVKFKKGFNMHDVRDVLISPICVPSHVTTCRPSNSTATYCNSLNKNCDHVKKKRAKYRDAWYVLISVMCMPLTFVKWGARYYKWCSCTLNCVEMQGRGVGSFNGMSYIYIALGSTKSIGTGGRNPAWSCSLSTYTGFWYPV